MLTVLRTQAIGNQLPEHSGYLLGTPGSWWRFPGFQWRFVATVCAEWHCGVLV